ncbi:MAG: hypothetical protein VXY32_06525 [Pseudomonadota bacterium]|nr:hypothetical protein [Pseudomonadota bacterium]
MPYGNRNKRIGVAGRWRLNVGTIGNALYLAAGSADHHVECTVIWTTHMITTRGRVPGNLSKISSTLLVSGQALGTGVGWPPMKNPGKGPMGVVASS